MQQEEAYNFEYHSNEAIRLGHIFPLVARLATFSHVDMATAIADDIDLLSEACLRSAQRVSSAAYVRQLLVMSNKKITQAFPPQLVEDLKISKLARGY